MSTGEREVFQKQRRRLPRSKVVVGIDLGTSACRFGIFREHKYEGQATGDVLKSVIVFSGDTKTVGSIPPDTDDVIVVTDLKQIIGRDFSDSSLTPYLEKLPFPVIEDPDTGRPVIQIGDHRYTAEELVAMLLANIRERVSQQLGENVRDAVISVPAFFSNAQRQATIDAGKIAGLRVLRIVSEPAAVALVFNAKNPSEEPRHIVVFDMGAGKLDISLATLENGVCTVVKTTGNTQLGGSDIDRRLVDHFISQLGEDTPAAVRRLRDDCERAKIELSSNQSTVLLDSELTRAQFEDICEDVFQSVLKPLHELFSDGSVQRENVSKVLLVGGTTKIPRIRRMLADFFGDGVELFDTEAHKIDVAEGAAMQGAILKGNLEGVAIRNSTPLSLGISLANGTTLVILPRGSPLPATLSTPATTFQDDQLNVGFDIVQGERPLARDNIKLGHITVEGIQRARRGVPRLLVEMTLDEDGILIVTAKDLRTGAAMTSRLENKGNLSPGQIDRLLAEAENEAGNDPQLRERAAAKSELEFFLERARKVFDTEVDAGRLTVADQEKVQLTLRDGTTWLQQHNTDEPHAYEQKYSELRAALNEVFPVQ
jgi:molecular chaperone DnaK (HSP70)